MKRVLFWFLTILSVFWITLNVYFLPFHVWTAGVVYPWFITQGLTLYKDVIWLRMPLDLFLLSGWYRVFGATGWAYQLFIWLLLVVLSVAVLWFRWTQDERARIGAFLFFTVVVFPLFLNVEVGELVVGVLVFFLFLVGSRAFSGGRERWIFLTGCLAGLVVATKQNAAAVALVPYVFLFGRGGIRKSIIYSLGVFTPVLFVALYFAFRGALYDFLYYALYTVIGPYRNFELITHGDGALIELAYGVLALPMVFFWKRFGVKKETVIWLVLLGIALVPSLLPSYLSYRAFTGFVLVSVVTGYAVRALFNKKQPLTVKLVILASFLGFGVLTAAYTRSYIDFIRDNGAAPGQYLTDYGVNEQSIVEWIAANTSPNDRIMSYGSEMIYVLADRLPANKYTNFTPFILLPYDRTSSIFINNPPKTIVFDWSHPDLVRGLSAWPFLAYMKENYREVKRFDGLVLYTLKR